MKKIAIYAFVAAMAAMTTSCGSNADSNAANGESAETEAVETVQDNVEAKAEQNGAIVNLSDDNLFRPDTKVEAVTVLDFNAVWCVPCKKLTPAFDKAAHALGDKVKFYSVDIDKNTATAQAFGITAVPTVLILSPAGAPQRYVGLDPFVGDTKIEDMTADQVTDLIYDNLVKLIAK